MKLIVLIWLLIQYSAIYSQNRSEPLDKINSTNNYYLKGDCFVSAFPSISGYFGEPFQGFGLKTGHHFSFGYFIAKQLSVNIGTTHILHFEKENMGNFPTNSITCLISPKFYLRYHLFNKQITPFFEAGYNNTVSIFDNQLFSESFFKYSGSLFGGLGIQIPLSNFCFCFTADFFTPVLRYGLRKNEYLEGSYGIIFKPSIGYYFKQNSKTLKKNLIND